MRGELLIYVAAVAAIALLILSFWLPRGRIAAAMMRSRRSAYLLIPLFAIGFAACLWSVAADRSAHSFQRQSDPVAVAVAFDLSPSMLATPDPRGGLEHPPRFLRARSALLGLFREIERHDRPIFVAVVGFTEQAELLMGWSPNLTQAREVVRYALEPGIFDGAGTSIEAAAASIERVFAMLPEAFRGARRVAIVASDGEDTMRPASFGYALETISQSGSDVIALQTGFLDRDEGIPTYDPAGEFAGFRTMGGERFTVPDASAMNAISAAAVGRGIYVRAEGRDVVDSMVGFIIDDLERRTALDAALLSTLGMFGVASILCGLLIR